MKMKRNGLKTLAAILMLSAASGGCSTFRSIFALDKKYEASKPIDNPFGDYSSDFGTKRENVVLRTKKGDRSIEVEIPEASRQMTDLIVPMSPQFYDKARGPASVGAGGIDDSYKSAHPTLADREIASKFPQAKAEEEWKRNEVEQGLGLMPDQDLVPEADTSYLAGLDYIKQLYRSARYEAALLENDKMIRMYPTDPRLHEMRGTLLDRMGFEDLAMKSWEQALEFEPGNRTLASYVEKRKKKTEWRKAQQ
jgi:tetratricopeptide (TPR) repeat protein